MKHLSKSMVSYSLATLFVLALGFSFANTEDPITDKVVGLKSVSSFESIDSLVALSEEDLEWVRIHFAQLYPEGYIAGLDVDSALSALAEDSE